MGTQLFGTVDTLGRVADAMMCIDADRPNEALVHLWGYGPKRIALLLDVHLSADGRRWDMRPRLLYNENENGLFPPEMKPDELAEMKEASAFLVRRDDCLEGQWVMKNGKTGKVSFRTEQVALGEVDAHACQTWSAFKEWAQRSRGEFNIAVFRGHGSHRFQLQTALSRAGRTRLERYCFEELREFHRHAEAILGLRLDLNRGDDYSTVLGLAQHHGLPTPLLDWTESAYIAAFFAFSDALEHRDARPTATHVRIFGLSKDFVSQTSPSVIAIAAVNPYALSLAVSPRHNSRLYAQQGRFLVTNVVDLQRYIRGLETATKQTYLYAADVPIEVASEALEDLSFMGLTAANLFPGLDGVGRMLRNKMYYKKAPGATS